MALFTSKADAGIDVLTRFYQCDVPGAGATADDLRSSELYWFVRAEVESLRTGREVDYQRQVQAVKEAWELERRRLEHERVSVAAGRIVQGLEEVGGLVSADGVDLLHQVRSAKAALDAALERSTFFPLPDHWDSFSITNEQLLSFAALHRLVREVLDAFADEGFLSSSACELIVSLTQQAPLRWYAPLPVKLEEDLPVNGIVWRNVRLDQEALAPEQVPIGELRLHDGNAEAINREPSSLLYREIGRQLQRLFLRTPFTPPVPILRCQECKNPYLVERKGVQRFCSYRCAARNGGRARRRVSKQPEAVRPTRKKVEKQ